MAEPKAALVEIKSAWYSKINWAQVLALLVTAATTNVLGLDEATQVKVLAGVQVVQSVLTIVLKTFYSDTVTPASLGKDK